MAAVSWPEQVFRYPTPYTSIPLWDASGVATASTISDTLRSGGILNLNSLAVALGEFAAPMGTGAALVLLRLCGKAASKMPLVAAVPLAVYTVAHFLPPAATVAAVAFVAFSVVMLWFAASMIRAYNDARVKK